MRARPVLINILLMATSIALVCGGVELFLQHRAARAKMKQSWGATSEPDPSYGFRLKRNYTCHDICTRNGEIIYGATYHTNAQGRRITPVSKPENRHRFLALFGCSVTFGLGINDEQTLGACLGRRAPDYMPYNFACQGYGTQQVLLTLQDPLEREIRQKQGIGIYVFFSGHINRVIGGMFMTVYWGAGFPNYEIQGDQLVRTGSFESVHPWRLALHRFLAKSETVKYVINHWPGTYSQNDYRLTARIIQEAARTFRQKFLDSPFYVMFFPDQGTIACADEMMRRLDQFGVPYLYFPDVLDSLTPEARTVDGWHPSQAANELMAERLTRELDCLRIDSGT